MKGNFLGRIKLLCKPEAMRKNDYHGKNGEENKEAMKNNDEKKGRVSTDDQKHVHSQQTRLQREHIFMIFTFPWMSEQDSEASVAK